MEYRRIDAGAFNDLWKLHVLYKIEIGEEAPGAEEKQRLLHAAEAGKIAFFGAFDGARLIGCCSVTVGFSTFNYLPSGVFEDFYILTAYRHKGVARALVKCAAANAGVGSLTVGCADCDIAMYHALGFSLPLGNLLAYE